MGALIRSPKLQTRPRILPRPGGNEEEDVQTAVPSDEPKPQEVVTVDEPTSMGFEERLAELEQQITSRFEARLADARKSEVEAQKELEQLRATVADERNSAHEAGFAAGRSEGVEAGKQELESEIERASRIIESLNLATGERLQREEDAIAEAVRAGLCKVLGNAFSTREGIAASVKTVCSEIESEDVLSVHLSTEDHAMFSRDERFSASIGERIQIVSDPKIELGGCLVEWSGGTLDGRLELQVERLRNAVRTTRQNLVVEVG